MEVLYFLLAAILCTTRAQAIPLLPPCPSQIISSPPVVATTIVDNSVSNALANALQLLIVSNLIENTMNCPCGCNTLQATVAPLCDAIPIQASLYSPAIDVITPDYLPYLPFDPIISPCDNFAPCKPVIDIIPNGCGCGCDNSFVPNYCCGNIPNQCLECHQCGIGCGNFPNIGNCGCNNCHSCLANIVPNIFHGIGLPNVGCGCNNCCYEVDPFCPLYACDQCGPIIPEVIYPGTFPPQVSYGCGGPNYPIGINVEPFGFGNNCYY